jgi:hypothetical protein
MRRLITYLNALFLGVILGMIFVAIAHAAPANRKATDRATGSEFLRLVHHPGAIGWTR